MPKIEGTNGTWDVNTERHDKTDEITIAYTLKRDVACGDGPCARSVRFIQTVKAIAYGADGRKLSSDWRDFPADPKKNPLDHLRDDAIEDDSGDLVSVDHLKCKADPYFNGDQRFHRDWSPRLPCEISMWDEPGVDLTAGANPPIERIVVDFETCVVCAADGRCLGCIRWRMVSTRSRQGSIEILSDRDTDCTAVFEKAVKRFTGNHAKLDDQGDLRWYCPETGQLNVGNTILGPFGSGQIPGPIRKGDPFGHPLPAAIKEKWLEDAADEPFFPFHLRFDFLGPLRRLFGSARLISSATTALESLQNDPRSTAIKLTWHGTQAVSIPSLLFTACPGLTPEAVAPIVGIGGPFSNDLRSLHVAVTSRSFLRWLASAMPSARPLGEDNQPVVVSIATGLGSERVAIYHGALGSQEVALWMLEAALHPDVDDRLAAVLRQVLLNMGLFYRLGNGEQRALDHSVRLQLDEPDVLVPLDHDDPIHWRQSRVNFNIDINADDPHFIADLTVLEVREGAQILHREVHTEGGRYRVAARHEWDWDGFDDRAVLDTTILLSRNLSVAVTVEQSGRARFDEVRLENRPAAVDWVKVRTDLGERTVDISVLVRFQNEDDMPEDEYRSLKLKALLGIGHHWSRPLEVDGTVYEVRTTAKESERGPKFDLYFVTSGERERSEADGMFIDGTIYFNIGYYRSRIGGSAAPENLDDWARPLAELDFARAAAHEFGHAVLAEAESGAFSATHKGTSTAFSQVLDTAPNYPHAGEVDLMKYYRGGSPYTRDRAERSVAAMDDVRRLISLASVECKNA